MEFRGRDSVPAKVEERLAFADVWRHRASTGWDAGPQHPLVPESEKDAAMVARVMPQARRRAGGGVSPGKGEEAGQANKA